MQMQTSSAPLLTDRTAVTPKPAGTYGYLRDSPGDEAMKPGRQVIRGKALWYAKSSPLIKRAAF